MVDKRRMSFRSLRMTNSDELSDVSGSEVVWAEAEEGKIWLESRRERDASFVFWWIPKRWAGCDRVYLLQTEKAASIKPVHEGVSTEKFDASGAVKQTRKTYSKGCNGRKVGMENNVPRIHG